MDKAKRARTAETPKQPSLGLKLRAPYLYPAGPTRHHRPSGVVSGAAAVPPAADDANRRHHGRFNDRRPTCGQPSGRR